MAIPNISSNKHYQSILLLVYKVLFSDNVHSRKKHSIIFIGIKMRDQDPIWKYVT